MVNDSDSNKDGTRRPPLHRSNSDRLIAGVAAGIADWIGVDTNVVRIGFVVLTLLGGAGVPLYGAAWLLIPEEGAPRSIAEDLFAHTRWS